MSGNLPLPVDRSHVRTEQRNPRSMALDSLDSRQLVELMIEDHRCVLNALHGTASQLAAFIDVLVPRMRMGGRLIYIGAGTSGRLGVLDAAECPPTFQTEPGQVVGIIAGGDASLRTSSEGREDDFDGAAEALQQLGLTPADTVLGIAAGGTTPYVLGGLRIAKRAETFTVLLSCAPGISRPPECDYAIVLDTGPEILTGSTRLKAGSATKIALNTITTAAFVQLGKTYSNLMVDLRASNQKLRDRAMRILIALCPEVSREGAAAILDRAGGHLKTAVVMQRLDVSPQEAGDLLASAAGNLRRALEMPR